MKLLGFSHVIVPFTVICACTRVYHVYIIFMYICVYAYMFSPVAHLNSCHNQLSKINRQKEKEIWYQLGSSHNTW